LHLLCKGIKRHQGDTSRPHLPITINILKILKAPLRDSNSHSFTEKQLLWSAFTLAFYGFLRASKLTSDNFHWPDVQLADSTISILLKQSKTDPFRHGHPITLQETCTSTCLVRAMKQFAAQLTQRNGPVFCGGCFNPLTREQLTVQLRTLLQGSGFDQQLYASPSFRISAATTAAAAGLPAWLIKAMGRWSSEAYQTYIHCTTPMLQSIPKASCTN